MLKRLLGPTNRRVRLCVGLMLVGLFCVQCIGPGNEKVAQIAVAVDRQEDPRQVVERLRKLAQTDHIPVLQYCLEHYRRHYADFRCTFIKQERIDGHVRPEQVVAIRFRDRPFSVAMAWTANAPQGDRVLYVEGRHDNRMLVRPTGAIARAFAPSVLREPDGPDARRSTLRTVNQFGFERGLESLLEVYRRALDRGDLRQELHQDAEVKGRRCLVLARYLPDTPEYPARETLVYIDQEYLVPIMVEGYGATREDFICRYLYTDIQFNAGLTDKDFEPQANDLVAPGD